MAPATTVVFQSYRTRDVPAWITQCLASVKQWALDRGHDYHFAGDEFLALAPDWYRAKAGTEICPVTDLARLLLAKELLARGHELAIWIDADVLVFDPAAMVLSIPQGFAFTHEVWVYPGPAGAPLVQHNVNNSLTLFARQNLHLDFFIDACYRIARARPALGKCAVGTNFLGSLRRILPFPVVEIAATISKPLLQEIADGDRSTFCAAHGRELTRPVACANLCASLGHGATAPYERAVDRLLATRGEVLNRYRVPQSAPA